MKNSREKKIEKMDETVAVFIGRDIDMVKKINEIIDRLEEEK